MHTRIIGLSLGLGERAELVDWVTYKHTLDRRTQHWYSYSQCFSSFGVSIVGADVIIICSRQSLVDCRGGEIINGGDGTVSTLSNPD